MTQPLCVPLLLLTFSLVPAVTNAAGKQIITLQSEEQDFFLFSACCVMRKISANVRRAPMTNDVSALHLYCFLTVTSVCIVFFILIVSLFWADIENWMMDGAPCKNCDQKSRRL